ncbi:TonB-dependent receptor [Thalassotalea maritima]|uniref:TonB-dependent receptor n=1 Tax=Thalassotalea maritima TaxID=3242416 RepID=UPI0035288121
MFYNKSILAAVISTSLVASFAHYAYAEQSIETITVHGEFRAKTLQQSASSLSVVDEQAIAVRQAQNLEEIIQTTANVNFASGSNRARHYQIRGIGERSQYSEPINPSVGVIIDDIDFTGIGGVTSLFDIDQVEVLRGPQGTKFGANALAGVINMVSKAPSSDLQGRFKALLGNYNATALAGAVSAAINDQLAYRVAVEQYNNDGFIDNVYLNRDDTNRRDEFSSRVKLAYKPSEHVEVDTTLLYINFDNGYDSFSLDNTRETRSDKPGFDNQQTFAASIKARLSDVGFANMELIATHSSSNLDYGYDEDWSNPTLCRENSCPYGDYASTDHYFRNRQLTSAEVRWLSKPSSPLFDTTDWVAGVYLKHEDNDLQRRYTYAPDFSSQYSTSTLAGFIELDTYLSERVELTTGLRMEHWQLTYRDNQALRNDIDDVMWGGKIVLAYQQTANTLWYGSVNRGFKAGGMNTDGSLDEKLMPFSTEHLTNYELGIKSSFVNDEVRIRLAVFNMQRSDMQVKTYLQLPRPDGSSEFITYLSNAASGRNWGAELETNVDVSEDVEFYTSLGLLDSEYQQFINANGEDYSGQQQAHAPNYQYHLGVNYYPFDGFKINVNIDGKAAYYFSDTHRDKSDSITLLNASIRYDAEPFLVTLWGRNINNKEYKTRGFFFGNDPRDGYTAKGYYQFGAPAEYGLTLEYVF